MSDIEYSVITSDVIKSFDCTCTEFVASMLTTRGKRKGPVCRNKLVLIYLCSLLLAESYAPEPNPGPRPCKYPCGYCSKAVKWTTPGICCHTCNVWYHQECLGMKDCIYFALTNVSWECIRCGMPNFSSALFDTLLFETSNHFDPLSNDVSAVTDTSFGLPQATSSPKTCNNHSGPRTKHASSSSTGPDTLSSTASEHLTHPSFNAHSDPIAVQRSLRQRDDIPLKVLVINCQSIVDKKPILKEYDRDNPCKYSTWYRILVKKPSSVYRNIPNRFQGIQERQGTSDWRRCLHTCFRETYKH